MTGGLWILGLDASPTGEDTAAGLRACGVSEDELPALQQAAHTLSERVDAQPRGLLHQDFLPDNLGWRGKREQMVVFDLHKNALGPRFADAAPYLGLPDWSNTAVYLDRPQDGSPSLRDRLTRHYLDEYARFGGPSVPLQTFREETTDLSWSHKVAALSWLAEQKQDERIREVLDFLRQAPHSGR
jgi:aminoglycoside/choline kinase family phosphotransferase